MDLNNLKSIFRDHGCEKVYFKQLSPNDNSKNQVYLGGNFEILNIFPIVSVKTVPSGDWKRERFKASVKFKWIRDDANLYPAPNAQLILYPKYPEVRFSGFLAKCENAPSDLMSLRMEGRVLFFGIDRSGAILGYVAGPQSAVAQEIISEKNLFEHGVFKIIELYGLVNSRMKLLHELKRIHLLNWINSKRLNNKGQILPCNAPHCGGYTLEAELGILPNGYSEPDYHGWEIKEFTVRNFDSINSSTITLMTPEPTHGIYVSSGLESFVRTYGYSDLRGKIDRMNFGGIHKAGLRHPRTGLILLLDGFDYESRMIKKSDGKITLVDDDGNEAASWSFA